MTHRPPLALALAAALLAGGCGTIHNLKLPAIPPPDAPTAAVCRAYGGVRGDVPVILDYPLSQTTEYIDYVSIPALAALDVTFSAFGDTFTLPYTAVEEVRRLVHNWKKKSRDAGELILVAEDVPPAPAAPAEPPAPPALLAPPGPVPDVPPAPPPLPALAR